MLTLLEHLRSSPLFGLVRVELWLFSVVFIYYFVFFLNIAQNRIGKHFVYPYEKLFQGIVTAQKNILTVLQKTQSCYINKQSSFIKDIKVVLVDSEIFTDAVTS